LPISTTTTTSLFLAIFTAMNNNFGYEAYGGVVGGTCWHGDWGNLMTRLAAADANVEHWKSFALRETDRADRATERVDQERAQRIEATQWASAWAERAELERTLAELQARERAQVA
jgi:hypothetical protein